MDLVSQQTDKKESKTFKNQQLAAEFEIKNVIGRGTFGTVYMARWIPQEQIVAIKSVIRNPKFKNREIEILTALKNENIVDLILSYEKYDEISKKSYINLVMEYIPTTLSAIIKSFNAKGQKIHIAKAIHYSKGMLEGLAYLESRNICHRDIKPSNILVCENEGKVKICDFGSAKELKKGEKSITYICSRYYRAPELILGCNEYSTKIDIWSIGCVIAEIITTFPLFDGSNNLDQIAKIIKVLGAPTNEDIESMGVDNFEGQIMNVAPMGLTEKLKKGNVQCPKEFIDLLEKMLVYDPKKRISAEDALKHCIFDKEFVK